MPRQRDNEAVVGREEMEGFAFRPESLTQSSKREAGPSFHWNPKGQVFPGMRQLGRWDSGLQTQI